jgi:hypothetical protein
MKNTTHETYPNREWSFEVTVTDRNANWKSTKRNWPNRQLWTYFCAIGQGDAAEARIRNKSNTCEAE